MYVFSVCSISVWHAYDIMRKSFRFCELIDYLLLSELLNGMIVICCGYKCLCSCYDVCVCVVGV